MTTFQINDTVGAIVRDHPALSRLFEQAQVDYCCGGQKTLAEACAKRGIDPQAFLQELETFAATESAPEVDLTALAFTELVEHIERLHHAYLHTELPRLEAMVTKVAKVHGDKEPRLAQVRDLFLGLSAELATHQMKEEQVLFPMIRQLEASGTLPQFHYGRVANPIHRMEFEHDEAGAALAQLRQLTDDYTPPEWACNTYRVLLDALIHFEQDMHQHVHKENNVLFPQAIVLEQSYQACHAIFCTGMACQETPYEPADPLGLRPLDNRFHDSTFSRVDAEDPDVVALVLMEAGR